MRCPLCGDEFDPSGLACGEWCPLAPRCRLICCPSCGYQVVDESQTRLGKALRRSRWRRRRGWAARAPQRPEPGAVPLVRAPQGMEVEIRSLVGMNPSRSARLSAFGLVPGTMVSLTQRRPVPIVRVGETELALSEEILGEIWVRVPGARPDR